MLYEPQLESFDTNYQIGRVIVMKIGHLIAGAAAVAACAATGGLAAPLVAGALGATVPTAIAGGAATAAVAAAAHEALKESEKKD